MSVNGRGAWTNIGHSTTFTDYRAGDGTVIPLNDDYKAVKSGIQAIQAQVGTTQDGLFGNKTKEAVIAVQAQFNLIKDGIVGVNTAKVLFRKVLVNAATTNAIPANILYGQAMHESNFDPGARGYFNPPDSGLVQINLDANPGVSWDQAFNPVYAFTYSAKRLAAALKKYASKPDLQTTCAIAAHNSPASADTWFKNGKAPNASIEDYVIAVLRFSTEF